MMETNQRSWLQVFVDAMMEKDPYKRLAMVRQLRNMPRSEFTEEKLQKHVPHKTKPRIARHR
jgi:hypothetical protein